MRTHNSSKHFHTGGGGEVLNVLLGRLYASGVISDPVECSCAPLEASVAGVTPDGFIAHYRYSLKIYDRITEQKERQHGISLSLLGSSLLAEDYRAVHPLALAYGLINPLAIGLCIGSDKIAIGAAIAVPTLYDAAGIVE